MRPYRRKHHSSWRTRRARGLFSRVKEYLLPFMCCAKSLWKLNPPFPLTAKVFITVMTCFILVLPLFYFLVPPFAAFFLINYFSENIPLDCFLTYLGEVCAGTSWPKEILIHFQVLDSLTIIFFLYDYYQILKCLRN